MHGASSGKVQPILHDLTGGVERLELAGLGATTKFRTRPNSIIRLIEIERRFSTTFGRPLGDLGKVTAGVRRTARRVSRCYI
jgi:hypothetical protein